MISGQTALLIIIAVLLIYGLFFSPLAARIPGWLRTVFAIVLGILAFIWLLNLLGVLVF